MSAKNISATGKRLMQHLMSIIKMGINLLKLACCCVSPGSFWADAGLITEKLNTKKSTISRIENHAEDIKLSTLEKFASVLGCKIEVSMTQDGRGI